MTSGGRAIPVRPEPVEGERCSWFDKLTTNGNLDISERMMKLLKLLVFVLLVALSIGYMREILELSPDIAAFPASMKLFCYGGLAFFAIWLLFRKRFLYRFAVFEHELTHILMAKIFFLKTLRFQVSPRKHVEGQVVVGVEGRGALTNVISVFFSLAPYFIPTLTVFAFALFPLIDERMRPAFFFLIGVTTMYHLLTTMLEFGFHQADIQKHGEYFSTAFILLGNIIFLGVVLGVLVYGDFGDALGFLVRGALRLFV